MPNNNNNVDQEVLGMCDLELKNRMVCMSNPVGAVPVWSIFKGLEFACLPGTLGKPSLGVQRIEVTSAPTPAPGNNKGAAQGKQGVDCAGIKQGIVRKWLKSHQGDVKNLGDYVLNITSASFAFADTQDPNNNNNNNNNNKKKNNNNNKNNNSQGKRPPHPLSPVGKVGGINGGPGVTHPVLVALVHEFADAVFQDYFTRYQSNGATCDFGGAASLRYVSNVTIPTPAPYINEIGQGVEPINYYHSALASSPASASASASVAELHTPLLRSTSHSNSATIIAVTAGLVAMAMVVLVVIRQRSQKQSSNSDEEYREMSASNTALSTTLKQRSAYASI